MLPKAKPGLNLEGAVKCGAGVPSTRLIAGFSCGAASSSKTAPDPTRPTYSRTYFWVDDLFSYVSPMSSASSSPRPRQAGKGRRTHRTFAQATSQPMFALGLLGA